MTLVLIQNDLRAVRRRLDDLYGLMDDTFRDESGSWSSKMAVSDALDAIDKAISSCPSPALASRDSQQTETETP